MQFHSNEKNDRDYWREPVRFGESRLQTGLTRKKILKNEKKVRTFLNKFFLQETHVVE